MLDERGGISPFGWAVACTGRSTEKLHRDVDALADWSARQWKRHFPAERGYRVVFERDEATSGLRMTATRRDFVATATIECITPVRPASPHTDGAVPAKALPTMSRPSIRAFGEAHHEVVRAAHSWGERAIARARLVGATCGIGLFVSLAWLMIGVNDPIYVLGGMLLVVAMLLTLLAGGTLGTWMGERLAGHRCQRARAHLSRDVGLVDDVRRWRAVSRKLAAQRLALHRRRGQPFRADPQALAS